MSLLKHVLHASIDKFVFSYFEGRIVFVINYGGYLIFVELVYDHVSYSRFQCPYLHEIRSKFSYPYVELGFHASQSLHEVSLVDSGSDHDISLEQSLSHDLLSLNMKLKSDYHQVGVRCDLYTCLVKSFGLASALKVFMLNHILHSFMREIDNIYLDDIPSFVNTWENSLALVEFDCDHRIYASEFSSCEIGCDLLIPLMRLFGFECVNVNGKGKVDFVVQIWDEFILIEEKGLSRGAKQFEHCMESLKGSDLTFVLMDFTCEFRFLEFSVITQKVHVDLFCFVFNPGVQECLRMQRVEFQILIFDPGALKWKFIRMIEIKRFTFDPGIHRWRYLRMIEIVTLIFDPGIREWEIVHHEEFYIMNFDPGGYRIFHSFICFYFIIYAFGFLGRNFDCILAIVAYLVRFGVVNTLAVFGLRVEEYRVDVDMFLRKGDRKHKFPGCVTKSLQYAILFRASLGRKRIRDVHVNSGELPDIATFFAGVGVFDDHFPILTCVVDIVYIFRWQVEIWDYDLCDATNLVCLYTGSGLWTSPFREKCTQDLRTNPFEDKGYDTILVRLASDVNDSIQDPGVQRMIICDWAEFYSRMHKMELNSSGSRDGYFLTSNVGASGIGLNPTSGRRAPDERSASQCRGVELSTSWTPGRSDADTNFEARV